MLPVETPFKTYTGLDGKPLDNGYVYFGQPDQDPIAYPVPVYWDAAGTLPAAQPLRTVNGYIMNAGTPANVFFDGSYSALVQDSKGRHVYYARTSDEFSISALVLGLAKAFGSSLIGFVQNGLGAIANTVQGKLRESVSVLDFMTAQQRSDVIGYSGTVDVTAAVQKALDYVGNLPGGGRLYIPHGLYLVTGTLDIKANTYMYGDGWFASQFKVAHAGDFLKSTFPINSSSAANINIKDFGAFVDGVTSTGGGYVDVCGTYINVENCLFQGFKFGVILDQSELVVIDRSHMLGWGRAGIWIVNGPDHTPGAAKGFTNRITISNTQFNAAGGDCILDDGGVNHLISGNNFNGGDYSISASSVSGLSILNNELEGAIVYPVLFRELTSGGNYYGPTIALDMRGNTVGGGQVSVFLQALNGGEIRGNGFYQYSQCAFDIDFGPNWRVMNLSIGDNTKSLLDGAGRTDAPFFSSPDQKTKFAGSGNVDQLGMTYSNQAPEPGVTVTTPLSMEDITEGCLLRVMNADGSNVETVRAYNVTSANYTANYASAKSAGFLIHVLRDPSNADWTPTPTGSGGGGVFTTSVCKGVYRKREGRVDFNAQITWSATAAVGQMTVEMPAKARADTAVSVWPVILAGPGAAAPDVGQIFLALSPNASQGTLVYVDAATGGLAALACPPSGDLYISGSYEV